ncbi:GldG family protein [Terricaulis silvestris]|uniref:Gliding-associated putative ABC transporter substrate-binding component GldG n=1 Tax=Terricaulis silvestris TaxID=2686094 RepID=A0A6I6MMV0_9CAUL|nr:GldG family protein [Terricaulis silvestris]QGZ95381.1 gliding-associated putative ABC transporter substrate-binding component GldG [Terricaulis silvestris]
MSARRFAFFAALALFVMFIAANITANSWFRSWRLDLTENQLYSLSRGTQETLNDLSEPVELTLYYSRDAAAPSPQLGAYAARVREMLQTFAARSHGRVRFVEVDVEAFSEAEDDAVEAGIEPIRPYEGADPIYFGLIGANAIDDQRVIPFVDPQREGFLEYEITRLIYELENPSRTRVALITSLPIDPAAAARPGAPAGGQSVFATELGRLLDVTRLAPDFTEIPDVDVLAIIHPGALSQAQLYAVDQFVLRKGRLFLALDPASMVSMQSAGFDPFNPVAPAPASSTLEPLLGRWGVTMTPGVVLDREGALEVTVQDPATGQEGPMPQPLFFSVPAAQLDREDLMTAWLRRQINFGLAGSLSASERDGVEVIPLIRTSGQTMRMSAQEAMMQPSPIDIMNRWPSASGRIETIALRLSGNLETAFPEGRPADEPAPVIEGEAPPPAAELPAPEEPAEPLARSATPAEIVIVADTDFLEDNFYVDPRNGVTAADNASFALNAIDVLGGSDALVSLRSRAPSVRRMDMVDDMEAEAERRIRRRQEELQGELAETEARLAALQERGRGSGFFSGNLGAELTPEENAEIERFRAQVVEVRGELRRTERDLRGDIDRLETIVVFINIWLAPLLIATAGLFFFWRRQRRGRVRR